MFTFHTRSTRAAGEHMHVYDFSVYFLSPILSEQTEPEKMTTPQLDDLQMDILMNFTWRLAIRSYVVFVSLLFSLSSD